MKKYRLYKGKRMVARFFSEKVLCPRRDEGPFYNLDKPDYWEKRGKWHCCSYCGSMKPSEVIAEVKRLGIKIVESTTKSYKRYIRLPGIQNATQGPIKFYAMHFSDKEIEEFNRLIDEDVRSGDER